MTVATRVGTARGMITPTRTGPLAGYAARGETAATHTIDELEATIMIIDDGTRRVVWVALDVVAVTRRVTERLAAAVRESAGADARVLVAASHTHSAPAHWLGAFAPGHSAVLDSDSVAELADRVREIAARAVRELAPARWEWTETEIDGLASLRAGEPGSVLVLAGVLVAYRGDRVVSLLVDAPCHPTVLGPASLGWSADWPGAMRRRLRAAFPEADVVFVNGACGDLSTRFTRQASSVEEMTRLGGLAADAVARGVAGARSIDGEISIDDFCIPLPTRLLSEAAAADRLEYALAAQAQAPAGDAVARSVVDGASVELALARAATGPVIQIPVVILGIGDVRWVATPLEVFSTTAEALRVHGGPVRLIGCVNDYRGYLPDDLAFSRDSYEARTTAFSAQAEPEFRTAVIGALTNRLSDTETA